MLTEQIELASIKAVSSLILRLSSVKKLNDYVINLLDEFVYREIVGRSR